MDVVNIHAEIIIIMGQLYRQTRWNLSLRDLLVKLEGYCRIYGPQTVYSFPRDSSPVVIGWNWAEFSRGNRTFSRYQVIFFGFPASNYVSGVEIHKTRIFSWFYIFFFWSKIKLRALKSGWDWLISGWKIGGPSCVAGFHFFGEILQQLDSPCETVCHRVFWGMKG